MPCLFRLAAQRVECGLRGKLGQRVRAPIVAPEFFEVAAELVEKALRLRNPGVSMTCCKHFTEHAMDVSKV
jgi:hypothetical protein